MSCVVNCLPLALPQPHLRGNRNENKRHQSLMQLLAYPKLSKIADHAQLLWLSPRLPLMIPSYRFRQPGRPCSCESGRYLAKFRRKSFAGLALRHSGIENVSGVACPCQPCPRFFSSRFARLFFGETSRGTFGSRTACFGDPVWVADLHTSVEKRGLEPLTSCLQSRRSTS